MKKAILVIIGIFMVGSLFSGRTESDKGDNTKGEEAVSVGVTRGRQEASENVPEIEEESVPQPVAEEEPEKNTEKEVAEETREEVSEKEVSPEFKEAMDSYEAFFDEYVEFMKKYSNSDDTFGMLSEYSDYMIKYADMMDKIDKIDTGELSTPDYAYYIEVTARIQKKLLEIAQ